MIQEEVTDVQLLQRGCSIANQDMTIHDFKNMVERETLIDSFVISPTDRVVQPTPGTFDFDDLVGSDGIVGVYQFPQAIINKNPVVREKLQHFKFFRSDVEIRILVNNDPFMAGMLGMHYAPYLMELEDSYQQNLSVQGLTSLPTTFLHTELANTATMTMPFINERDYFDLTQSQHSFGTTVITNWGVLPSDNNTIKVQVYARFVNSHASVPTNHTILIAQGGTENENEGPVTQASGLIGSLGTLAGNSGIPIISTIGSITSWVSRAVGAVASQFGWSKPINVSHPMHVERTPAKGYTHTMGTDGSVCLGTIPDNAIDSRDTNPNNEDEMVISHITMRTNIFQRIKWDKGDEFDELIGSWRHEPNKAQTTGHMGTFDYVSGLFQYWRGTVDYHIKFIKTQFHKGRLIFVYFPNDSPIPNKLTTEISTNYTCIIDLNEMNDAYRGSGEFVVSVPFMHSVPWMLVNHKRDDPYIGTIGVYVSVPLSCPSTCADYTMMWVGHSGGKSYELAIPKCSYEIVPSKPLIAQGGDDRSVMFGSSIDSAGMHATIQCIGERVDSLRPLVKRFTPNSIDGRKPALTAGTAQFYPQAVPDNDNSILRQIQRLFRFHAGGHRFKSISTSDAIVQSNLIDPQSRFTGISHTTMSSINNFNEIVLPHYSVNRCWATGRNPRVVPEFTTMGVRYDSYSYPGVVNQRINVDASFPALVKTDAWEGDNTGSLLITRIDGEDSIFLGFNPEATKIQPYQFSVTNGDSHCELLTIGPDVGKSMNIRIAEENTISDSVHSIYLITRTGSSDTPPLKVLYSKHEDHTDIRDRVCTLTSSDDAFDVNICITWTIPGDHTQSVQLTYFQFDKSVEVYAGSKLSLHKGDVVTTLWGGDPNAVLDKALERVAYRGIEGSVQQVAHPFATMIAGHDDFNSFFLCNPPLTKFID